MNLSDLAVRNAKPQDKPYKLTDGDGMFLLVQPNGGKYWRLAYRYLGKQKTLALGVYPEVSLALARQRRAEAREQLAKGADPGEAKKADRRAARLAADNSFEVVALAWLEERRPYVEPRQHERTLVRLKNDVFPWLGKRPIADIDAPEILAVLKRIDSRGARFTAHRIRSEIGRVFVYGIKEGHCKANPAASLRRLGYDTRTEITGHGFRAMARTILHEELEQKPEVIEHQLAHTVPDTLGRAYNRTKFIKERSVMMQKWAHYLDQLKLGAKIIPIAAVAG